jgi:hypothetical protein
MNERTGNVLTLGELTVDEKTRKNLELAVLVNDALDTVIKILAGLGSPPVSEKSISVKIWFIIR